MTHPRPLDGDLAEGGFEGEGSGSSTLDATTASAVTTLEDQFLVGLLDEGFEEPTLEFEAGLMDKRLDPVGEMRVVVGQGQGHLEPEFEGERLTLAVDGAEGEGSLKAVGVAHDEFPYWHYGGSSCVFSSIRPTKSSSKCEVAPRRIAFLILCNSPSIAHQLASARKIPSNLVFRYRDFSSAFSP